MTLELRNITRAIDRHSILQDVSFKVPSGVVMGVIGPNGAGKTTLFECIAGIQPVVDGSVRWNDANLAVRQRKDRIFFLPDSIVPYADSFVGEVVDEHQALMGGRAAPLPEILVRLELRDVLHRRVSELSKGFRKRLLLALALLSRQPLLMLDEPFDGFDLRQTRHVGPLVRELAGDDRTLLVSIHQLRDAERMCECFVLLVAGKVIGCGTLSELAERAQCRPDLEEVFLALT